MTRLTRQQVREIDRLSIEQYGIPGIVLMENASRAAADLAISMIAPKNQEPVLILCGGGNNGGDGLAIARHLHNATVPVQIARATDASQYSGDALINWKIVSAMGLPVCEGTPALIRSQPWALIVDAIFGTGLAKEPRAPFGAIAEAVNRSRRPVLAIDVPSGLDCDTGRPLGACIRASKTISFVAEKAGFAKAEARPFTGEVHVGDIGSPRELISVVQSSAS